MKQKREKVLLYDNAISSGESGCVQPLVSRQGVPSVKGVRVVQIGYGEPFLFDKGKRKSRHLSVMLGSPDGNTPRQSLFGFTGEDALNHNPPK